MKRFFLIFIGFFPLLSQATDNMTFHGTLVVPPCTISSGKTIEVSFGTNLGVNKIDGSNYKQSVNYTVDCESGYAANNLAIVVDTTNPAAFDSSAVQTDKTGLGIRILVDGAAATFASRVAVSDPVSPPVIEAVPVKDQSVALIAGAFEASLTLRADYL